MLAFTHFIFSTKTNKHSPFICHSHHSASFLDPLENEIAQSQLNDEKDLKFKPLQLQQGESVDEKSLGMEEGFCDFVVPNDDDDEYSQFQSSSIDPDDIINPIKQLKVSSFVVNHEHLCQKK